MSPGRGGGQVGPVTHANRPVRTDSTCSACPWRGNHAARERRVLLFVTHGRDGGLCAEGEELAENTDAVQPHAGNLKQGLTHRHRAGSVAAEAGVGVGQGEGGKGHTPAARR